MTENRLLTRSTSYVLVLLLAVVCVAALGTTAAAAGTMSGGAQNPEPGATTSHGWSTTYTNATNHSVHNLTLDYSGSGTDLSSVTAGDVSVFEGTGASQTQIQVHAVDVTGGGEVLTVDVNDSGPELAQGETLLIRIQGASVTNPGTTGSYPVSLTASSDGTAVHEATGSLLVDQTGSIDGTISYQNDTAADGAQVVAYNQSSGLSNVTTTDANGAYELGKLAESLDYTLQATKSGYSNSTPVSQLTAGQTTTVNLTINTSQTGSGPGTGTGNGTITGQVTNASDVAIENATVTVVDGETEVNRTTTDESGHYSVAVPEGTYDVVYDATGYEAQTFSPPVNAGGTTTLNVTLSPIGSGGGGSGPSGSFENVSIVDETISYANGSSVPGLSLRNYTTNLLGIAAEDAGDQDISGIVDTDTELSIRMEVKNFTPRVLVGTGKNVTWTTNRTAPDTVVVVINGTPASAQYLFDGQSSPDRNDWPTGDNDTATDSFDAMFDFAISGETGSQQGGATSSVDGMVLATDAQSFSSPQYDSQNQQLTMDVAGPHYMPDGNTTNDGFVDGYLPKALLDEWGVTGPSQLTAEYQNKENAITVTNTSRRPGFDFRMDIHYSSGTVVVTTQDGTGGSGSDGGSGGISGGGGFYIPPSDDGTDAPTDDASDDNATDNDPTDDTPDDENEQPEDDQQPDGDAGDGTGSEPGDGALSGDGTPGFGALAALLALFGALGLRGRSED